ncbi:MAG TPA: twin transmembrane helix small protein [Burkholderiales bacterium]|nr:twin transmembrane helix small protein [Burkholderiales bacterium]
MRYLVIAVLLMIVASLASAAVFMLRGGGGDSRRMFKALAVRVGLSLGLFLLLMAGYYFGLLTGRL